MGFLPPLYVALNKSTCQIRKRKQICCAIDLPSWRIALWSCSYPEMLQLCLELKEALGPKAVGDGALGIRHALGHLLRQLEHHLLLGLVLLLHQLQVLLQLGHVGVALGYPQLEDGQLVTHAQQLAAKLRSVTLQGIRHIGLPLFAARC